MFYLPKPSTRWNFNLFFLDRSHIDFDCKWGSFIGIWCHLSGFVHCSTLVQPLFLLHSLFWWYFYIVAIVIVNFNSWVHIAAVVAIIIVDYLTTRLATIVDTRHFQAHHSITWTWVHLYDLALWLRRIRGSNDFDNFIVWRIGVYRVQRVSV